MPQVQRAACRECALPSHGGSLLCEGHLRGLALVTLDRRRWPPVKLDNQTIAGDEQWRPCLRKACAADCLLVLKALGVDTTEVNWK